MFNYIKKITKYLNKYTRKQNIDTFITFTLVENNKKRLEMTNIHNT